MSYRISTVAEMAGIPRNTLIAWERRYGLLNPERQQNGYRFYTDDDVGILLQIKNALNGGLKISEAVGLVRRYQDHDASQVPRHMSDGSFSREGAPSPFSAFRARLVELLLAYKGEEAKALLSELVNVPFEIRLHEVFFPVLREVGDRWERGEASVAQEHFASGVIRTHLAALFVTTAYAPLGARHAACTTLPHDEHEIAALALAVQLGQSGYRVSYLGSKMPLDALEGFVEKQRPNLLCISCITLPQEPELSAYIERIARLSELGARVVLGGRELAARTNIKREGVEIYADWRSIFT